MNLIRKLVSTGIVITLMPITLVWSTPGIAAETMHDTRALS